MAIKIPEGKYFSSTKVGEKGQIVIPKELRIMFDINPGDNIVILGDVTQGIAILPFSKFESLAPDLVMKNKGDKNEQ